jgi:hypothetical protein
VSGLSSLVRQLRSIVDSELIGVIQWDRNVIRYADQPKPDQAHRHRPKMREMVVVGFPTPPPDDSSARCRFEMGASSSEEHPPCGRLRLTDGGEIVVDGPLNQTTSKQIGAYIRQHIKSQETVT